MKNILVTGGYGFVGTNFIKYVNGIYPDWHIYNLDALTYIGKNLITFVKDWPGHDIW